MKGGRFLGVGCWACEGAECCACSVPALLPSLSASVAVANSLSLHSPFVLCSSVCCFRSRSGVRECMSEVCLS